MPAGEVVSVQVDSSTWISWGRSPYKTMLSNRALIGKVGVELGRAYGDDGFLTFYSYHDLLALDIDDHVPALEVSWYFEGDIQVADLLRPFVWEGSLVFCFLCTGCCLFGGSWLYNTSGSAMNIVRKMLKRSGEQLFRLGGGAACCTQFDGKPKKATQKVPILIKRNT